MPQPPQPKPVDPAELPQLAQATMKAAKFPMLATVDGDQPRLRPVSPVRTDGFVVYVANLRRYGKTHELAANPKAELCYKDDQDNQVRITAWPRSSPSVHCWRKSGPPALCCEPTSAASTIPS
jgi:hypothetical protein